MKSNRYNRQSFLGSDAQEKISSATIAIIGLGGGGSHIVQQLSHIGFQNFILFDPDIIEESNLNRMVGATEVDVIKLISKVEIAERIIRSVCKEANIISEQCRWQTKPELLYSADVIFGCVDGFAERRELELAARRYLIPLIDIGMDIFQIEKEPPRMAGHVIASIPEHPCFSCYDYLNVKNLSREASKYGVVEKNPQVIWPNAILSSAAIGIWMSMLTNWNANGPQIPYFSFDGNANTLNPDIRLEYFPQVCAHFKLINTGEPTPLKGY